jgi:tail tube protein
MANEAISAQGTLIARAPAATPTVFTTIGDLRDITPPPLMRNPIETTSHNDSEETFVVGIKRKGELQFTIGFVPGHATHDELTGLIKAWNDGSRDIYKITYPDGTQWLFSGFVTNVGPSAPVDDGLTADVTIRPTHVMTFV